MSEQAEDLHVLQELTAELLVKRAEKEAAAATAAKLHEDIKEIEARIVSIMRAESLDAVSMHGFGFSRQTKLNVRKTDREALFHWLREMGYGGSITENIHQQTLAKVVTDSIEVDGAIPPGVEVSEFDVISVRKK